MKNRYRVGWLLSALLLPMAMAQPLLAANASTAAAAPVMTVAPFGDVTIYRPAGRPVSVVLFISGDGGWNLGVVSMAQHLANRGALVVGIDIRGYRKWLNAQSGSSCQNYAVDFEALSHAVQQRLQLDTYLPPIVAGYSSGATLAYALVVQAPKGTFASAMSLGFCPDLDLVNKPCAGSGLKYDPQFAKLPAGAAADATPRVKGLVYRTAPSNTVPWVVFQGEVDQVCEPAATKEFVAQTGAGELVALPSVGHGYGVEKNWLPQFLDAHSRLISAGAAPVTTAPAVGDLPLVEVPARAEADAAQAGRFAILLTGDGGWAGLDQEVSAALAAQGVPVVGLNTLKYFWHARDPQAAANDLGRIIASYAAHWNAREVLLVGYSFGADVLPFLYNRLPVAQRAQVRTISLLGLSENASFEFHLSDWIPGRDGGAHPTVPEIGAMNGAAVLCLYGSDEKDSPCPTLKQPGVKPEALPGGHHLGGDYAGIAGRILDYSRR